MSGVNKVILLGNLGSDPEVKYFEKGGMGPVAKFRLATTEVWKDRNGERQERTEWHNIVLWKGWAETAEKYLRKGDKVYLEGRIQTRSWEDKDGNKKFITEIVGDRMTMLSAKRDMSGSPPEETTSPVTKEVTELAPAEGAADDLPF